MLLCIICKSKFQPSSQIGIICNLDSYTVIDILLKRSAKASKRSIPRYFRRKKTSHQTGFFNVADAAGVEPATAWFVARYSIQLSYASAINCFLISHAQEIANMVRSHKRQIIYPTSLRIRNKLFFNISCLGDSESYC